MKLKFLYILSLFSTLYTYGQVTLVAAVEDRDLKVNEDFIVTFVLEVNGNDYVQESPLRLPDLSKYTMLGNASETKTYIDPKSNVAINQIVYQVALQPKTSGKNRIGSALVQVNGRMYKTEPIDFYVGDAERKTTPNTDIAAANQHDLYLNMEVKKREVYTNQPTIAVLRAYSKDFNNFRKVSDIEVPDQNNLNIRTVSLTKSDIEHRGKGEAASQVIAVFMIFPTESGKIDVKPVSAKIKDKKIYSNKVNLNVKKLPSGSPADFKNAVGTFKMNVEKSADNQEFDGKFEVNKPLNVIVRLNGEGNLQNAKIPTIVPNERYKVYPPKISKQLVTGNDGVKGEVTAHYVVVPIKPGKISIETEGFAYFDPKDKKYIDEGARMINLNVLSHEDMLASKSTIEKVNDYTNDILETVNTPIIGTNVLQIKEKDGINWNTIILNITLFSGLAFLLFYLKKSQKKKKLVKPEIVGKPIQTIAETERILRETQRFSIEDHLQYLEKMRFDRNAKGFFSVYDEMLKDLDNHFVKGVYQSVPQFFEKEFGNQESENYRKLSNKISIDKYSPLLSDEDLDELYSDIRILFSKISK